jgi:hypothetical protein
MGLDMMSGCRSPLLPNIGNQNFLIKYNGVTVRNVSFDGTQVKVHRRIYMVE